MRSRAEAAAPSPTMVWLGDVVLAVSPDYYQGGVPGRAEELVGLAEELGLRVARDWGDRPVVSEADARTLFVYLSEPRPAIPDAPRVRGHVTAPMTFPDPAYPAARWR